MAGDVAPWYRMLEEAFYAGEAGDDLVLVEGRALGDASGVELRGFIWSAVLSAIHLA